MQKYFYGPRTGIPSLLGNPTPEQKYYNDKIIRDNMDAIREDMSLYFDPPEEKSGMEQLLEGIKQMKICKNI